MNSQQSEPNPQGISQKLSLQLKNDKRLMTGPLTSTVSTVSDISNPLPVTPEVVQPGKSYFVVFSTEMFISLFHFCQQP